MAYTVLARKYRPQTFADLVGQEHVTRTLSNAIRSQRVAHAFLFTGVRGVGKTTTARILAKALNCAEGPTPEPCGTCDACVDIAAGRDTDVLEMDGASNNSVEDVRRLQESIPYRPSRDRFKVVIVDEVHMLSTGAFNAFLKTLEEPPEHVKFIFATTEVHKVPVTIRSRCQRYDFRLIPQAVVTDAVRGILENEGVEADDEAVAIVAREAAGSMRDALTLLDQIVAFAGEKLVGEEVARVLGIADRDVLHQVAAAVLGGDGAEVLRQVDHIASHGLDVLHFARQLLELLRDMVVLQVSGPDTDLVAMVDEERQRATETGGSVDLQELQRAFSAFSNVVEDVAQSGTPRTTLEMGLVRLATRPPLLPLAELVARLEAIERRAGGGGGGPRRSGPRGGSGGARPDGGARAAGAAPGNAAGSASGSLARSASGSATASESGSGSAFDPGGASGSRAGPESGNASGTASGAGTWSDSGIASGAETASATGSDSPSASGSASASGSDSGSAADSGIASGAQPVATRSPSAAVSVSVSGSGPGSASGSDSGSAAVSGSDSGSAADSGIASGAASATGSPSAAVSGSRSGSASASGSASGSDAGSASAPGIASGAASATGSPSAAVSGSRPGSVSGSRPGSASATASGSDSGSASDLGIASGAPPASATGSPSAAVSGSDSDPGIASGSGAVPGSGSASSSRAESATAAGAEPGSDSRSVSGSGSASAGASGAEAGSGSASGSTSAGASGAETGSGTAPGSGTGSAEGSASGLEPAPATTSASAAGSAARVGSAAAIGNEGPGAASDGSDQPPAARTEGARSNGAARREPAAWADGAYGAARRGAPAARADGGRSKDAARGSAPTPSGEAPPWPDDAPWPGEETAPAEAGPARRDEAAAPAPPPTEHDPDAWETIVSAIMDDKPALGAVLQHAAPLSVSPAKIVLAFPRGSFFGRQAEALDGRRGIARAAARVLGTEPAVEVTWADAAGEGVKTLVEAEKERRDARIEQTRREALSHPLVLAAAQLFRVAPERMSVRVETE